jgi:diguanylate cyclase (GGDEF)-like protein/PAS domain S-box-containing protein
LSIALYKNTIDRELSEQKKWLSAIIMGVGDGIIATDKNNVIRFMNPLGEELCGWKEESARGRKLSSVLRIFDDISELPMDIPQVMETRLDSPAFFNSAYAINKHGGRIHIEGSVAPIVEPNKEILGQVISFRDVTDLRRMSETISYQASHDTLTGLYNREEFLQILGERIENMEKAEKPVFYFFIDIDNFRIVNDLCGHLAGDELLRQLSRDIRALFPSDATISRLAADSFGILFSSAYPEEALDRSQAILHTIRRTFLWQKNSFKITGSVGIVLISTDSKDVYTILAMGEDACRIAKEEGGNRCRRYEGKDKLFLKRRGEMQWITRLTTAVEENRFVLFKQDILPLDSTSGLPK